MILGFEFFHPKYGICPETFPEYAQDIVYRSREILFHRSTEEIYLYADLINWIVSKSPAKEEAINALNDFISDVDAGHVEEEKISKDIHTSTYAIKAFHLQNPIAPLYDGLNNILWSEIFAALSLTIIDKTLDDEIYYKGWAQKDTHDWLYEWRILSHASYWLIEAMDAIATAEGFKKIESYKTEVKAKVSERNTSAAISRHAKTNYAILELAKLYQTNKYKSMRNAAQLYCNKFPEKVAHLAYHNQIRTLSEGLSNHLNGSRRSSKVE